MGARFAHHVSMSPLSRPLLVLFASAALINCGAESADAPEQDTVDATGTTADIFDGAEPAQGIELKGDFSKLSARDSEGAQVTGASVDGTFLAPSLGIKSPLDVTITVRGNTSVAADECSFPKLKVKFKDKTQLTKTAFKGHSTVRIATHCGELQADERTNVGRVANEVSPWREAFAYRVVRAAGVEAPRARPVTIGYEEPGKPTLRRKAAFIETTGDVADRLKAKEAYVVDSQVAAEEAGDELPASPGKMRVEDMARINLVEALIGNSDFRLTPTQERWWFGPTWSEPMSELWNMKAVRFEDGRELAIPMDFDLASLVAPPQFPAQFADFWGGQSAANQGQFQTLMASRVRFSRAQLDAARASLAAREAEVLKMLDTPWIDAESKAVATQLFPAFFQQMKSNAAFYVDVVAPDTDVEYVREDGTPDDECLSTTVPAGTPIHRFGRSNAKGLEEVALLDLRFSMPCNKERVWLKKGTKTTANFPL